MNEQTPITNETSLVVAVAVLGEKLDAQGKEHSRVAAENKELLLAIRDENRAAIQSMKAENKEKRDHDQRNNQQKFAAIEALIEKKATKEQLDTNQHESDTRYQAVIGSIASKADDREFKLIQKMVFGCAALILVSVIGAVIALVVFKPDKPVAAHHPTPVVQQVQPQGTQPKPAQDDPN